MLMLKNVFQTLASVYFIYQTSSLYGSAAGSVVGHNGEGSVGKNMNCINSFL